MAISKSAKIEAEIEKVKGKIAEQQARLKELEQKKHEAENTEIVDIVRGMSISLSDLPLLLQSIQKGGGAALGHFVAHVSDKRIPSFSQVYYGRNLKKQANGMTVPFQKT